MGKSDKFDDGFSELLPEAPSAARGIGDNSRGTEFLPVGNELEQNLLKAHKKVLTRAEELQGKAGSFRKVDSVASLKKATEYVRQLQEVLSVLDGAITAERAPYRVALGQIKGTLGDPMDSVEAIKRATEGLMNTWNQKVLREERARLAKVESDKRAAAEAARRVEAARVAAAAEAKRKANEAVLKAAQKATDSAKLKAAPAAVVRAIAKADEAQREADAARDITDDAKAEVTRAERAVRATAADLTRARSPNAVQSAQEFVDFRDVDKEKIDLEKLRPYLGMADLEKALREYVGIHGAEIKDDIRNRRQPFKGVEFWINLRTRVGG